MKTQWHKWKEPCNSLNYFLPELNFQKRFMQMLVNIYNYIYGYNYFSLHTCSSLCLYKWDCCCSVTQLCLTLWDPMDYRTLGFPVLHYLLEFAQTHVHWVSDAMQPSHPLSSPLLLPSIFPSIQVFSSESVLYIRWPKYRSFSFSISPSSTYSGLISSGIDLFDLLAVQGTLKSLLQHNSSKASILGHSALFMIELSHPYMTTGKTITLTNGPLLAK